MMEINSCLRNGIRREIVEKILESLYMYKLSPFQMNFYQQI